MSWLSSVFHKVTGVHLSSVTGPLLGVAGAAVGLPVIGGIAGGVLGGAGGSSGGGNVPAGNPPTPTSAQTTVATPANPQGTDAERLARLEGEISGQSTGGRHPSSQVFIVAAVAVAVTVAAIALFKK